MSNSFLYYSDDIGFVKYSRDMKSHTDVTRDALLPDLSADDRLWDVVVLCDETRHVVLPEGHYVHRVLEDMFSVCLYALTRMIKKCIKNCNHLKFHMPIL